MARKRRKAREREPKCPVTFALDTFGDKWSLLVLRDIVFKGKRHYVEFLRSAEEVSTNILADRLAKLEEHGIVSKAPDREHAAKYVYGLTEKGIDLLPMLLEMVRWSVKYDPQPDIPNNIIDGAPPRLLERWRDEPDELIAEIVAGLEEY